jgi:transketolase
MTVRSHEAESATSSGAAAQMGRVPTAGPFGKALIAAAERREEIVGVTADLTDYTDMKAFRARFPDRYVNVGMAEQNLVAVASGLEMSGLAPVATTFAVFLTRRAFDFAAMQVALHHSNLKLACSLVGIGSTFGPTHQGIEDIAHMRSLPGMTVIDPCDPVEMEQATTAALDIDGPVYLRMLLGKEPIVLDPEEHRFELGRADLLREGGDLGIVASSTMVACAMEAAEDLSHEGVEASVLKVSTVKPFDADAVAGLAEGTGALVTAENHSVVGGLFTCVAESLATAGVGAPVEAVGMQDEWGSFGTLEYNAETHGLTADAVKSASWRVLERREHRP